jgi:tetratricopeptide (TPR) repeat protein
MIKIIPFVLSFACLLCSSPCHSQQRKIDSLEKILATKGQDTTRAMLLILLAGDYLGTGNYQKATLLAEDARTLAIKLNYKKGQGSALNTLGIIQKDKGNLLRALRNYHEAIKLFEETQDKKRLLMCLGNIGFIHETQKNYEEALRCYNKSLQLSKEVNSRSGISRAFNNIGNLHALRGNLDEAEKCYREALKLNRGKNAIWTANNLANLGDIYVERKQYKEGLVHLKEASDIFKNCGNRKGQAETDCFLGYCYGKLRQFSLADEHLFRAIKTGKELDLKECLRDSYENQAELFEDRNKFTEAFTAYKLYILYRDSLLNEENTKKIVQQEMQYEFDKQSSADSIKNSEAKKLEQLKHEREISGQKTLTYTGIGGFLVMIVIAGISYNAFRNKKKANVEIARQKLLVEVKQKEILDSIYYARRIQRALITNEKYIERNLKKFR